MEFTESMIRTVKIGDDEYATMDNYGTELNLEEVLDDEFWSDEDQLQFTNVSEALWSDAPLDRPPPAPEQWVDQLAAEVKIDRLLPMNVLQRREESTDQPSGTLTTRFVYDWRKKLHKSGQEMCMRRSCFVAREFASTKKHDTYSPATGCTADGVHNVFMIHVDDLPYAGRCGENPTPQWKASLAQWNSSDTGTKPPATSRLMMLLNQVGAIEPISMQMVGQEEFETASERLESAFLQAPIWGLEPLLAHVGVDAAKVEDCLGSCDAADHVPVNDLKRFGYGPQ
eukprot:s5159_g1.t1